jgi:hypothetical protein
MQEKLENDNYNQLLRPKNAFLEPVNDCLACKSCMKNCLPCAVHSRDRPRFFD